LLPAGAFAGWGSHPLESAAFSRRTQIAVALWQCGKKWAPSAVPVGAAAEPLL